MVVEENQFESDFSESLK